MELTSDTLRKIKFCFIIYIPMYLIAMTDKGFMGICVVNLKTLMDATALGLAIDLATRKGGVFPNFYEIAKIFGVYMLSLVVVALILKNMKITIGLDLSYFTGF